MDRSSFLQLPFLRDLNETTAVALLANVKQRSPRKWTTLIKEGEFPDFLHIIVDGFVELFSSHNDKEVTFEIAEPASPLFLTAVMCGGVSVYSARTITPSRILMIPAQDVRDLCKRDPLFAQTIINRIADGYNRSLRDIKNIRLCSNFERAANWILQTGRSQDNNGRIELKFGKAKLAALLGMPPETLSRSFALLREHGVRSFGRTIIIENMFALAKMCHAKKTL